MKPRKSGSRGTGKRYDPTPKGDWLPLIGLSSHEDLGWCWHDGDYLHIAIERAKLAERDFSTVASDAG